MEDVLVSFATAKLAKEKGFNLLVLKYYDGSYMIATQAKNPFDIKNYNLHNGSTFYSAPTQSLLAKWLRDVHNLSVEVCVGENKWEYSIYTIKGFEHMILSGIICTVYEEALEAGLSNALQLLKNL
jgi:hypothetical protein